MLQEIFKKKSNRTAFIMLNTKTCEACWQCISVCPQNVIDRINLPWHKHARLANSSKCIGCLKCVKTCAAKAIVKLS